LPAEIILRNEWEKDYKERKIVSLLSQKISNFAVKK
jgi:hypothetical protein